MSRRSSSTVIPAKAAGTVRVLRIHAPTFEVRDSTSRSSQIVGISADGQPERFAFTVSQPISTRAGCRFRPAGRLAVIA